MPIDEDHPQRPSTPTARRSSWSSACSRYGGAYGLRYAALRYFNAAGADPDGGLGEHHDPETHLIPLVIEAALGGAALRVFGTDYPTPDGTCVRDYIHVVDLAEAHLLALDHLAPGGRASPRTSARAPAIRCAR